MKNETKVKFLIIQRKKLNITQLKLSELSGVGYRTITGIEQGYSEGSLNTWDKINETLILLGGEKCE